MTTGSGRKRRPQRVAVDVVRVYDDPGRGGDEQRVLVDRLWPRGRTKASVDYDEWAKDAAPTAELRRWYGHQAERFAEFRRRYTQELGEEPAGPVVRRLREEGHHRRVVLLTATRDLERSGAEVLRSVIVSGRRARRS